MKRDHDDTRFDGGDANVDRGRASARVRRHAAECDQCASAPLPLETLGALFARADETAASALHATAPTASAPHATAPALLAMSTRVLAAAAPLLTANAAYAYRSRLISGVVLSLAPFPLLVFFNLYLLREAYMLLSSWLPAGFVAWLIVGYAAMLLLVCALTYASLPLLIARARQQAQDAHAPLPSSAYA